MLQASSVPWHVLGSDLAIGEVLFTPPFRWTGQMLALNDNIHCIAVGTGWHSFRQSILAIRFCGWCS